MPSFSLFQKIEARVSADEDLKLSDLLKYYLRESQAAKVTVLFIVGFFIFIEFIGVTLVNKITSVLGMQL